MADKDMKTILQETFDAVSSGYDGKALRFFPLSAENMALLLGLQGNELVLDVACGTGHASLAVARRLAKGRVTAVDFSAGMLGEARRKASASGVTNIDLVEGDMQALPFPDASFDAAVCAFGIFFVEDMERQLAHIASKVKPGGRIMISCFQESYFHPLKDLMGKRLIAQGVTMPQPTWKRIAQEAGCRQLFEQAALTDIRVEQRNVGYFLDSADEWWDIVWNAGYRRLVDQLSPPDRERFQREHLEEVAALATDKGIWLDVGVIYASGAARATRQREQ